MGAIRSDKYVFRLCEEADKHQIYADFAFTRVLGH
jgi:hypothetical protein